MKKKSRWGVIIGVLIILFLISSVFAGIFSSMSEDQIGFGNTAVIPINGIILTQLSTDLLGTSGTESGQIVKEIKKAEQNPNIKAIVLEINSPGGAPVATDEIASAIHKSKKTTVAWIREIGASGGYWIASSADHIVANRMSITGSIGVIGSYLDFSGIISDYNISYEKLVGGMYKDTGTPFRALTDEERKFLQKKLDLLHDEFKYIVQTNRGLTNSQIELVGNGQFYLGREAKELGLVDELGGEDEVINYIEDTLNITVQTIRFERRLSFTDILLGLNSENPISLSRDNLAMFR